MKRLKMGQWYRVRFWDHVMGHDKPCECVIFGYLIGRDEVSYTFSWWECDDNSMRKDNQEPVVIIKSTITDIKPVKAKD